MPPVSGRTTPFRAGVPSEGVSRAPAAIRYRPRVQRNLSPCGTVAAPVNTPL